MVVEKVDKLSGFMEIADVKFPQVLKQSDKAVDRATRAYKALQCSLIRKSRINYLRELWKQLKANAKVEKRKRAIVVNVLDVGRIF